MFKLTKLKIHADNNIKISTITIYQLERIYIILFVISTSISFIIVKIFDLLTIFLFILLYCLKVCNSIFHWYFYATAALLVVVRGWCNALPAWNQAECKCSQLANHNWHLQSNFGLDVVALVVSLAFCTACKQRVRRVDDNCRCSNSIAKNFTYDCHIQHI